MMPKRDSYRSVRLCRLLLRVYPADFRREYGEELAQVFLDCCREAWQRRGPAGLAGL